MGPTTSSYRPSVPRRLASVLAAVAGHGLARLLETRWPRVAARCSRWLPHPGLSGPERLRTVLEELGGTFIKLGQMLALQPDILSLEYCNALFQLLDRVPPFPYEDVERTFVEDLGSGPREVFDRFERGSFAAASIGQVHRAWLGGRKLAVKVRRPSVERDFAGDIRLMSGAVALIRRLGIRPLYWLLEPLTEFIAWTREELDYRNEARYMDRLRGNATDTPAERVPEVLWELTTERILVMEYLEGLPVIEHLRALEAGDEVTPRKLRAEGFEPDTFARGIIDNFLGDAFRHGVFHADLHPANLLILPGNVVGYIDFGITGVLSAYSRRALIEMTLAYTRADLDGMCEAFFKVSTVEPGADPRRFRDGLARLAESWYERRGRARRLSKNFTLVMLDMLKLSRATGVWPERDVIKYIRSAIAIDGLVSRFAPGFEVGAYLEQVCARHLRLKGLHDVLSAQRLLDGALSGSRLARDGALRGDRLVDQLLRGEIPVRAEVAGRGIESTGPSWQVVAQAGVAVGAALLLRFGGAPAEVGWNPFTAQLLLLSAAVAALLRQLRQPGRPDRLEQGSGRGSRGTA